MLNACLSLGCDWPCSLYQFTSKPHYVLNSNFLGPFHGPHQDWFKDWFDILSSSAEFQLWFDPNSDLTLIRRLASTDEQIVGSYKVAQTYVCSNMFLIRLCQCPLFSLAMNIAFLLATITTKPFHNAMVTNQVCDLKEYEIWIKICDFSFFLRFFFFFLSSALGSHVCPCLCVDLSFHTNVAAWMLGLNQFNCSGAEASISWDN